MKAKEEVIREKILVGLDLTCKKLVESKKEMNHKFVISDRGKVVELNPYEVELN